MSVRARHRRSARGRSATRRMRALQGRTRGTRGRRVRPPREGPAARRLRIPYEHWPPRSAPGSRRSHGRLKRPHTTAHRPEPDLSVHLADSSARRPAPARRAAGAPRRDWHAGRSGRGWPTPLPGASAVWADAWLVCETRPRTRTNVDRRPNGDGIAALLRRRVPAGRPYTSPGNPALSGICLLGPSGKIGLGGSGGWRGYRRVRFGGASSARPGAWRNRGLSRVRGLLHARPPLPD